MIYNLLLGGSIVDLYVVPLQTKQPVGYMNIIYVYVSADNLVYSFIRAFMLIILFLLPSLSDMSALMDRFAYGGGLGNFMDENGQ